MTLHNDHMTAGQKRLALFLGALAYVLACAVDWIR